MAIVSLRDFIRSSLTRCGYTSWRFLPAVVVLLNKYIRSESSLLYDGDL